MWRTMTMSVCNYFCPQILVKKAFCFGKKKSLGGKYLKKFITNEKTESPRAKNNSNKKQSIYGD